MSYTYDAEGELTKRHEAGKSNTFTYGFGSKLKQIAIARTGAQAKTVSYDYDGAGKRVKVTNSSGTRYFLYDGGMPVLELDASKNISASYLYGADGVVYRRIHGATTSQDTYEYHHTNPLGSPIVLTDSSKNVVARYEYDVFGAVHSESGASDNTRKFTGKEYDSDVRLYYFAARYYDPYIGRFTQRDPAGDGINWYIYTYNNPLKFIDPTERVVIPPVIWYNPDNDSFYTNDNGYVDFMSADDFAVSFSAVINLIPGLGDGKGLLETFK